MAKTISRGDLFMNACQQAKQSLLETLRRYNWIIFSDDQLQKFLKQYEIAPVPGMLFVLAARQERSPFVLFKIMYENGDIQFKEDGSAIMPRDQYYQGPKVVVNAVLTETTLTSNDYLYDSREREKLERYISTSSSITNFADLANRLGF